MTEDFIVEDGILISYKGKSKDVIMPDGIVRIGDSAFSRKAITSVTMPDSVESIGFGAFSDCKKLTNVVLSKNLKSIGINAFLFCDSLEKIGFPEGLEEIGICAFSGCLHLKEALLPKSISEIGSAAFSGCSELVSIGNVNPEAVIGKTAFDECVGLADENGFVIVNGCLYCISPATDSQAFEIPDSVSRIEGVFGRNLRFDRKISLMIPSSVKHIDDGCLSGRRAGVGYSSIRIDMEVDDSKEIKRLVYKVFDFEQLADLFLRDGLVVGKSIRDYMVKEVSSKKNRDSFMSRYLYSKESKPLANLLSCVKKIPLDELDAYIEKTDDVEMKNSIIESVQ